MPDSHFTGSFKGHGDYDAMGDAFSGWLGGGISGVSVTGALTLVVPVAAPSASGVGEGYDCTIDIPLFTKQPGVEYLLKYSDDGLVNFSSVGYEITPGNPLVFPNGYHMGRQFSVFGNDCPGEASEPLA